MKIKTYITFTCIGIVFACFSVLRAENTGISKSDYNPYRRDKFIEKYDTNGDGVLDEDEKAKLLERRKQFRQQILKKYDTDGDGKLNEEEKKNAKEGFRKRMRQTLLKKYDTNGDGKLDEAERAKLQEERSKYKNFRGNRNFPKHHRNTDQSTSQSE